MFRLFSKKISHLQKSKEGGVISLLEPKVLAYTFSHWLGLKRFLIVLKTFLVFNSFNLNVQCLPQKTKPFLLELEGLGINSLQSIACVYSNAKTRSFTNVYEHFFFRKDQNG